jgi:hypothetical protein
MNKHNKTFATWLKMNVIAIRMSKQWFWGRWRIDLQIGTGAIV